MMDGDSGKTLFKLADYLPENTIKLDDPRQVDDFVRALKDSQTVISVDLSQISIGKDVALVLGHALASHGELRKLRMVAAFKARDIDEVKLCLEALADGIARSGCKLVNLDLSENAFRGIGIRSFAAVMTGLACFELEVLKMSDQGLSPEGGQVLGTMLDELLENAKMENRSLCLRVFKASKNRLENLGAIALGKFFQKITSLEEVEIYQCGINSVGITAFIHGLSYNRGLRCLDILDNTCTGEAEKVIAAAMKNWPKLEELHLNSCLISTTGMVAILSAIKSYCSGIKILDIGDNEVDGKVEEILNLVSGMQKLEAVVFAGNDFYDKKRVRELFRKTFVELGKPSVIKKSLEGGHSYGLAEHEETDEDEESEEDTGRKGRSPAPSGSTKSSGESEEEVGYLLKEEEENQMWSLTIPSHLKCLPEDPASDDHPIVRRIELNQPFKTLHLYAVRWQELFLDERNYQELLKQICRVVLEKMQLRSTAEEAESIAADHVLDAILQYIEYISAYATAVLGGSVFLEEFFKCTGLIGEHGFSNKDYLKALAWLLRHVLEAQIIPLSAVQKMHKLCNEFKNREKVLALRQLDGFDTLFAELGRQNMLAHKPICSTELFKVSPMDHGLFTDKKPWVDARMQ